jgi:heme/copper-type cytochrome/quinol oxidase subunit 2
MMVRQQKLAILIFLASGFGSAISMSVIPAMADGSGRPPGSSASTFEDNFREAFRLLADPARMRADWTVTAKASQGQWRFVITDNRSDSQPADSSGRKKNPSLKEHLNTLPPMTDLVLPQGAFVSLRILSDELVQTLVVPELGIKVDAIPGRLATLTLDTKSTGIFPSRCGDMCGSQADQTGFTIHIVDASMFQLWLDARHGVFSDTAKP